MVDYVAAYVVTVSPVFTDEVAGELYRQLYVILPNRAGDDFVGHRITLAHVQDMLLAELNRTALILADLDGLVQGI
jgi:hypothetical protein